MCNSPANTDFGAVVTSGDLLKLESLTVVILSRNRPEFLKRTAEFWTKTAVELLVLDGSDEPNLELSSRRDLTYVHDVTSVFSRLRAASHRIQTEFVIQACDDELYSPSALEESISFLRENPDYVACTGRVLALHSGPFGAFWQRKYTNLGKTDLSSHSVEVRVGQHLASYTPAAIYSVVRSSLWCRLWPAIAAHHFTPDEINEMLFEFLSALCGIIKVLPAFFWL